jgi:hypothetical protein
MRLSLRDKADIAELLELDNAKFDVTVWGPLLPNDKERALTDFLATL